MKRIIVILFATGFSRNAIAQSTALQDTSCSFLKNIKFKNGIDTVEVKATYEDFLKGSDYSILKVLDNEKKLNYSDYGVDTGEVENSHSISFTPINCHELFEGTLRRKIYSKKFVQKTHDIGDYSSDIIQVTNLKVGQIIYLKCIVFEDKRFRDNFGTYFFTIIDMSVL